MRFSIHHFSYYSKLLCPTTFQKPVCLLQVADIYCTKKSVFFSRRTKDIEDVMFFPKYDSFFIFISGFELSIIFFSLK